MTGIGCRPLAAVGLVAVTLLAGASSLLAEVIEMSLYRRTGLAPIVIWGEVTDGEHRYAQVRTLELFKCSAPPCPEENFRIAYKLDSFLRKPWEDKITFQDGERLVLFLRKFTKEDGQMPEGDLYTLMWGAKGRHELPAEGEKATVDAVRAFHAILEEDDFDEQERMILGALASPNPILAETAFSEATEQGLGSLDLLDELTGYFEGNRDTIRIGAMRLMGRILEDSRTAGRWPVPQVAELRDLIRGRAALDPSEPMRVEAVKVLAILGGDDAKAFLERLAKEDASQMVRYEAERVLIGWR